MRHGKRAERILVTPREIAGVVTGLQEGLRRDGRTVDVLLRWPHPFRYDIQKPRSSAMRLLGWLVGLEHNAGRLPAVRRAVSLLARVASIPALALRYDAVIYVGADTLLRHGVDRAFLRRVGRRVVTVFCGSDARPPYLNGAWVDPEVGAPDLPAIRNATEQTRRRVERAEQQSTYVVNHPATAQFHTRPYIDWTVLGMPGPEVATQASVTEPDGDEVVVLHAPSAARWKGTETVRATVAKLAAEGQPIHYVEISGRPHSEVQEALAAADVVVDELYSDALLAGIGTEAARLGKALIVCGYAGDLLERLAGRIDAPTSHYLPPAEFETRLRQLLADANARAECGGVLRRFVRGYWAPEAIAGRYGRLVDGAPDDAWFDDPPDYTYVHGWGVSTERLADVLRNYVAAFGEAALFVDDANTSAALRALMASNDNAAPTASRGRSRR